MKNVKYILFALLLSFISITVYAKDNIEIKSITLDSKSETTTIKSEPTFSGLEMNYDIAFEEVGDFAKYKIVIENNTNKAYKVSEEESFKLSDYVTYSYESAQLINANQTATIYVIIKYSNEIDESLFVEGKYIETNKAILQMTDQNNVIIDNPKTGVASPILIIVFTMILSVCIVIMINKKKPAIMMIVFCICLIPIAVYAVETLKLTINVKIEIKNVTRYKVGYIVEQALYLFKEDEIDDYVLSSEKCKYAYVNDISEENKYYICNSVMKFDTVKYKESQSVALKPLTLRSVAINQTNTLEIGTLFIHGEINTVTISEWKYTKDTMTDYGYEYLENDNEIMSFDVNIGDVMDYWTNYGKIETFNLPSFKMPAHDVLFIYINEA